MKKFARIATVAISGFMLFAFTNIVDDAAFEGVVSYDIKIDSDNPQAAQMMQGSTLKTYIKGDLARVESNFGMYKQIIITDKKKPDEPITCIDIMGNKYQIKVDATKTKKDADAQPDIKYLDGTKTIAGYACKEAQITVADKRSSSKYTMDIYYTDQLPWSSDEKFKGLKGFPLSYGFKQQGITFNMTANTVTKQSVADSMFVAPKGYKLMTQEEMQKDMASKMGGGGN